MKFFQNENLFRNNIRESSLPSPKTTLDLHKSWYRPVTNRFSDFSFFHWKKSVRNNIRILSRVGPPNFGNKGHTKKSKIFFQTWNLPRRVSFQDVRTKKNLTNYLIDPHVIHRLTDDFWKKNSKIVLTNLEWIFHEIRWIWNGFSLIEDFFILDLKKLPEVHQTMCECSKLHWYYVSDISSPSPFL